VKKINIIFAASEVVPYAKTGGLADVAGALPQALTDLGCNVAVVMPRYQHITTGQQIIEHLNVPFAHHQKSCAVWHETSKNYSVFFIDAPEYFHRTELYGARDDVERFAFFSRAVMELCRHLGQPVDVLHCNDWMTGLIPVYHRTVYTHDPIFAATKTVLTIHNLAFQGLFHQDALSYFGLSPQLYHGPRGLEFGGVASTLKGGILYADAITTVSNRYAFEIQTREHGFRMDGLLRMRRKALFGILNGIDVNEWNPATDHHLAANYSWHNLSGKRVCKQQLIQQFALRQDFDRPLIGVISRLSAQKGFDLIIQIIGRVLETAANFVLLGSGAGEYEHFFQQLRNRYPDRVGVYFGINNPLAHQIEAGSDIFLMPSAYEPCGLNQMYSLRYGTVPIVRATGGLDDTVINFNRARMEGNGFKFYDYQSEQLLERIYESLIAYGEPDVWRRIMLNGMQQDFSWQVSARKYLDLYYAI
jgi:starch synthase